MVRFFTLASLAIVFEIVTSNELSNTAAVSPLKDLKHRNELVDEAFSEQKDVLLEMLEAKLREVKDKKKKKKNMDKTDLKLNTDQKLCDALSKDKGLTMRANGISNVGIVNLLMNHGPSGKGHLNLDADGISNVGRAHLELGMEGGANIPGVSNSLVGSLPNFNSIFCNDQSIKDTKTDLNDQEIVLKEIHGEDISLRKSDGNTTDANATKTDANTTNTDTNVTKDASTKVIVGAEDVTTVATTTAATSNATTVDADDINVGNKGSTIIGDLPTTVSSTTTTTAPESTVSVLSNLATVPK